MRYERVRRATLLIVGGALCALGPAHGGDLIFSGTAGQAAVAMNPPCRGKKIPTIPAMLQFPPAGVTVDQVVEDNVETQIQCQIDALRANAPVKGLRGRLDVELVAVDEQDPTGSMFVDVGSMPYKTDASGRWAGTISGEDVRDKVPLLGDIPILGMLFRADSRGKRKADALLILCSAQVVPEE